MCDDAVGEEDDDQLRLGEIQPTGGQLEEHRFEDGESVWSLRIECREVERPDGSTLVSITVEYMDFGSRASDSLAGAEVVYEYEGDLPPSIYFYEHFAYDQAVVRVLSQEGSRARVSVEFAGDCDGLGLDQFSVTADVDVVPVAQSIPAVNLDWD